MKISTSVVCLFFFFLAGTSFGQNPGTSNSAIPSQNWSDNPFEQKVFVENKGQFNESMENVEGQMADGNTSTINHQPSTILFQAVSGGVKMYFTKQGMVYRYDEMIAKKENGEEENEKDIREVEVKHHALEMQWVGSNPSVELLAEDKVPFYYTYSFDPKKEKEGIKASAYKKIIYRNLYPNIDAVYEFPSPSPTLPKGKGVGEQKVLPFGEDLGGASGVKYSLIVHPGANLSDIKMNWKGNGCSSDASGNIIIKSSFGDFIDHAPNTFYEDGEPVSSSFQVNGNIVSFNLKSQISNLKSIIIDPWTSSPTFSMNSAYDVNYDFAGNVYAFGSSGTFQEAKFNSGGALLWVFSAASVSTYGYYGDFAVDGTSGTSYLGEGYETNGAHIAKVNTNGVQTGLYNGYVNMREIWRMDYNYCNGTILIGGGGTSSPSYQAFTLDTNLVNINPVQVVSTQPDIDCALLTTDKYSGFGYLLFAREFLGSYPALDNYLVKCPLPGLLPVTWGVLTNHTFIEVNSVNYVSSGIGMANGFNGLAASPNFVYSYDGSIVKKWNKTTGALVSTLNISGTVFSWGGLDVDECDNIYVGVQNQIKVYDVNWNPVTTYNLSNTVYDLRVASTKLYACGNGFVSEIDLTTTPTSLSSTPATCSNCNGTATVNVASCNTSAAFTYLWAPGGQTTQTATGLCPGNYTVTVFSNCNVAFFDTVNVNTSNGVTSAFTFTNVCLGMNTVFTDNSSTGIGTITGWAWNFGDGNTSTLQNPSHTYTASGTYTVSLIATSSSGCFDTTTNVINVNATPVANFSATTVCQGNPTQFTDLSTGATTWSWNFGDGNTSALQNPSNTYATSGTYSVTLISSTANGCSDTTVIPVTVNALPVASFTTVPVCVNTPPALFTDQSTGASQWSWNFGDPASGPNNTSTLTSPSHNYATSGSYSVTLIVTSASGCTNTTSQTITVNPAPTSNFATSNVCFNNATPFTDQSTGTPTQWAWNFGDGNTDVVQNPSHTYNADGTFTVTLIATNSSGCKDTFSQMVTVYPLPAANFSAPSVCVTSSTCFSDISTISSGNITGWSWNFGDPASGPNNISNAQNPCHVFTSAGTFQVFLTVTSNNACQSNISLPVTVSPPPTAAFTVQNNCLNAPTVFADGSINATQWAWNFGDGNNASVQNPIHTYLGNGTYIVTLIIASGGSCKDTITDTVTVYPLPIVDFSADTVCVGNTTSFTDASFMTSGNITSWSWNFADPVSGANNTSSLQNPTHIFTQAGNYNVTLTLTSNQGCVASVVLNVIVHPLPLADFSTTPAPIASLIDPVSFNDLSTGGVVSWTWDFGDNSSLSTAQNPVHEYSDTGSYVITLYVVSQYGCRDTVQHPIEIRDFAFYVPNAFTPNGDGNNDFFFAKGIGIVEYELWIFDRWGNRIFYCHVNDLPQAAFCRWDGKVDGGSSNALVQEDVYVWKIHFRNIFKQEMNYVGTVTVVR